MNYGLLACVCSPDPKMLPQGNFLNTKQLCRLCFVDMHGFDTGSERFLWQMIFYNISPVFIPKFVEVLHNL
jgi:hypothetical protein